MHLWQYKNIAMPSGENDSSHFVIVFTIIPTNKGLMKKCWSIQVLTLTGKKKYLESLCILKPFYSALPLMQIS